MANFELAMRVYWEDTDAGGIVYHANYLKFFERARTEWLRALGLNQNALREETGCVFVATELTIKYLRPARLDDQLVVTAAVAEQRPATLRLAQQAFRVDSAHQRTLLSSANVQIAWVDAAALQPRRIPSHIVEAFRK